MYDIKQFLPALYFVLVLGLTAFCFAVESPGLWVLGIVVIAVHGWLLKTRRFRPLPRMVANAITLLALVVTFQAIRSATTPIITIGQFLVFLQLVKLYELRANRDFAQLLVLSLLLMVAGAISTPSLAFGVMLIVYLFVSLYVCLLFHLKVENDHALAGQTLAAERVGEATVRQDQRYLPRSMRKLAGLVSFVGMLTAVVVFLFFPRGSGAGMFGQLQIQRPAMTGFSEQVSFNSITNITQSNDIVAHVQVWKNGTLVEGTEPLMLRGRTLDRYVPSAQKWTRAEPTGWDVDASAGSEAELYHTPQGDGGDEYRQRISLRPTGTRTLFALPGPHRFTPSRTIGKVVFSPNDETLVTAEQQNQRFDYEVVSRNASFVPRALRQVMEALKLRRGGLERTARPAAPPEPIPPRIAEYARRPEVSGSDGAGRPLASLRARGDAVSVYDAMIAGHIQGHLRSTFRYSLDLTGERKDDARDPNEQFLYDWKKGHCEYFASAMVLMCQSLGMQARMVTGFKVSPEDYDGTYGRYYIVRQSHAHAWVEVKTPTGWQAFDPTSGTDEGVTHPKETWRAVKNFFNWLEFKWAEKVVAYDGERRDNLIQDLDRTVVNAALSTNVNPNKWQGRLRRGWASGMAWLTQSLNDGTGLMLSAKLVVAIIFVLVAGVLYGAFTLLRQRYRMRRRAARIGLDNLPASEAMRLARQLGFYERLMTLLERRRIVRPRHVTPAEFTDGLSFLPNEAYDTIRRLTRVFYSIRYGGERLGRERREELEATVNGLEPVLEAAVPAQGKG
jgi:transglutaminase-like putative cysteine protease